jgi:tyrosyl-tRNA synthetase
MPLVVNKATGKKFGKSEAGAVWLDAKKTSVYKFYQFWFNVSDGDVIDYLKVFTLLPKVEIENLRADQEKDPAQRPAQKRLALEVTAIVHGPDQAKKQAAIANALFGTGSLDDLSGEELTTVQEEVTSLKVQPGSSVIEVLTQARLAASNSEARRLLQNGGIYVNNRSFNKAHFDAQDFKSKRLILRRGKAHKDSALIELS